MESEVGVLDKTEVGLPLAGGQTSGSPGDSVRMVAFLVGCPRSGTTWLLRLIASSPDVRSGSESYLFAHYVSALFAAWQKESRGRRQVKGKRAPLVGLSTNVTQDEFENAVRAFSDRILDSMAPMNQPGKIFIEKTPAHALYLSLIDRLVPGSKFIHIVRDPRDVVASILRIQSQLGWELSDSNPRSAARLWVSHVKGVRSIKDPDFTRRLFEVRYEDLLGDPQKTVRSVLKFLGASCDESALKKAIEVLSPDKLRSESGRPVRIRGEASRDLGQEFQMPKEFVGKATAGNWKDDLSAWQKFWVWYVAGNTMEEFGYPWSPPWWYQTVGSAVSTFSKARRILA